MLASCILLIGAGSAPQVTWKDLDGDGVRELVVTREDGTVAAFRRTATGSFSGSSSLIATADGMTGMAAVPRIPFCPPSIEDQAAPSVCVLASSNPTLGMLLPLGNLIAVTASGNVGIGNTTPGQRLSVQGVARTLSGGLRFADGTILSTATPVGPPGIPGIDGPVGPSGPPGPQGPQGPLSAMASLNQKTGAVTIAVAGQATLVKTGNTLTLGVGPTKCTWGTKTYSVGAKCYETMSSSGCSFGTYHADFHTCQSSGNWSNGYSSICNWSIQPGPKCGQ